MRDGERRLHLLTIENALRDPHDDRGQYPETEDLQNVCRYRDLGVGGVLLEYLAPIPVDSVSGRAVLIPFGRAVVTLFATMERPPGASNCPSPLPRQLRLRPETVYCLQGEPER